MLKNYCLEIYILEMIMLVVFLCLVESVIRVVVVEIGEVCVILYLIVVLCYILLV